MSKILLRQLFCLGLLSAFVAVARTGDEKKDKAVDAKVLLTEFAKVREILASADELPPKNARWAKVQVGSGKDKSWRLGWLISENADAVELLQDTGSVSVLSKKKLAAKAPEKEFGWYDLHAVADADFAAHCREILTKKKETKKDEVGSFGAYRMMWEINAAQNEILLFARLSVWAREAGKADLANELAARSMKLHQKLLDTYPYRGTATKLHAFVADQTYPRDKRDGANAFNSLSSKVRGPREQREEQLAYLNRLVRIPYRPKHKDTVAAIGHYESLVAEDKAWKEPTKEEFAKYNVQQKVDYWLYHLRDLDVHQSSQPGMCNVLSDGFGFGGQHMSADKKPNAAVELKKLSYDAIPKIIAHLEDGRPTKCVGYWRDFAPESYHALTYGDCCQQIFEAIAFTSIYERPTTSGYPHRDGVAKQCKERAEAWWKDFQKKGEKQVLIEGVSVGRRYSDWQAERLIEKYPDAAFVPIAEGIRAAKEDWIQSNLLNSIRSLKDDRLVALLRDEAKGPFLTTRVNACVGLLERSQENAIPLLISEWKSAKIDDDRHDWDLRSLRSALVLCGRVNAQDALFARWKEMPIHAKIEILEAIGDWKKDYAGKPATKELAKATESRLASCLDERDEDQQLSRVCDVAASGLSKRWNLPKLFDPKLGPVARNRAILEVKNVWLKSQGRKPVVVPVRSKRIVETKEAESLLAAIVAAPLSDDAKKAMARIEVLGLPSLVSLRDQIKNLKEDHPARKSLEAVASRNACTISAVRFSDNSPAMPAEMLKIAESLNGKPLSANSYVETALAISKLVPANVRGFCLAIDRDGDDTGMVLEIRVLPRNDPRPGEALHLRREEIIRVAGNHFHHSMGAGAGIRSDDSVPMAWSRQDFDYFAKQLNAALEAPSDAQLQVRITVARGR